MAEDGDSAKQMSRHKSATHTAGIVTLPPGSRGPRSLYLRRYGDSFGFTLRHFIVYPPDSVQDVVASRHSTVGALLSPMETIFVKNIAPTSSAELAGLQRGDRIVAVNGVPVVDKTYAQVVHLIQQSPEYLHLLVVPKEEDVLQKFFAETAHNPISNQVQKQDIYFQRQSKPVARPGEFHVDAASWKSLQEAVYGEIKPARPKAQRVNHLELYERPEDLIDDSLRRPKAQPQVPLYRNMGRRASEGSAFSNNELRLYDIYGNSSMKSASRTAQLENMQDVYANDVACRLSLDGAERKDSSMSSMADGSKDSLSSYDSVSTVTGSDVDDTAMTRLRKNLQRREEFLRRPSHTVELPMIQREFYGRPKKLDKPIWPPEVARHPMVSPPVTKPVHQNVQRIRTDIDAERNRVPNAGGDVANSVPQMKGANSPKERHPMLLSTKMREASPAPAILDNPGEMNGASSVIDDDRRLYLTNLQMVSKRTKQFESGRPLPEDDPMLQNRTSFYRSELARISSKRVEPHVTVRAHEFESRSNELQRQAAAARRFYQENKSLDSSGSNASNSSVNEAVQSKLSGNVMIPSGGKYIHVPPPESSKDVFETNDNLLSRARARSNSVDSWTTPMRARSDGSNGQCFAEDEPSEAAVAEPPSPFQPEPFALSPLIPESVEHVQVEPPEPRKSPVVRPNKLDLGAAATKKLQLPRSGESSPGRSVSPANSEECKPVVMRRTKNTNMVSDEDRAMRRESYLKATGNGRMHVDDFFDDDAIPQAPRSAHRKWRPPLFPGDIQQLRKLFEDAAYSLGGSASGGSSSSVSLDREKISSGPAEPDVVKEGLLHCKVSEIDGKRAADRSWKQVWAVVRGSKLSLFKDKQHQSPADAAEPSLAGGVDISTGCIRTAEDYAKKKHVFRVLSINPCRTEILLQADNPADLADWVKTLQSRVDSSEAANDIATSKPQQAVPQTIPASTTVQVEGSNRLSPQPAKSKLSSLRNRSPTGQSPVSKTRKPPSQVNEGLSSPKSKTWRGRVAKQFRKIQGASSPCSPTAPEGSTFGVSLDQCYPSTYNQNVPRLVEVCTNIVESKGLETVGVYRVPGNSAAITALTNSVNQSYEGVPELDAHWNDVHVVSSLLKSFFRKLPDALLTSGLYSKFIEADKVDNPYLRMMEIRRLVRCLPTHHYHTLKHLMLHLKRVTENCDVNKMEGRNLAIVFGPTLIRAVQDDMATLVNDMSHNYKIVESLICHADWFFCEDGSVNLNLSAQTEMAVDAVNNEMDVATNRALLLDNISKVEGIRGDKVPGRELFSSIISAAHRKIRKGAKSSSSQDSKEEPSLSSAKEFATHANFVTESEQNMIDGKVTDIPTTVVDMENCNRQAEKSPWFNYSDQEHFRRRVENFIQETQANLQRNRKTADFSTDQRSSQTQRSSQDSLSPRLGDPFFPRTDSASNSSYRSLNSNSQPVSVSSQSSLNSALTASDKGKSDVNQNREPCVLREREVGKGVGAGIPKTIEAVLIQNANFNNGVDGVTKKIKYGNENDPSRRTPSLDSLNRSHETEDGGDLQSSIMKIFDEKKKTLNPLLGVDLPFADESPERPSSDDPSQSRRKAPASPKLYQNPSLHKSLLAGAKAAAAGFNCKEAQKAEEEKDRDCSENVPDNERHISSEKLILKSTNLSVKLNTNTNVNFSLGSSNSRLRRSESLNKERTVSPLSYKLKRSESLNKPGDRVKRSDTLTKNEKTENNNNKRRELSAASRKSTKELTKLKRKNGMPERSIKRRHTVGGTKDFDKINWLDNRYQEECAKMEKDNNEKTLRTSSPDLSSTRRERIFFEVNLIGPENMIVALRQHLIGTRPQSLPESRIFTVPLESRV